MGSCSQIRCSQIRCSEVPAPCSLKTINLYLTNRRIAILLKLIKKVVRYGVGYFNQARRGGKLGLAHP
ncbi:hypothetical protein [Moorena producens]|uniref:hypothetical protein n=1 Tax=Moorena producens TaxID=1155739 RepID=UPI0011EA6F26|nr:hypothetical protein [Moorena producens]